MRAFVLRTPGPLATRPLVREEIEAPRPGPGEILVRVAACGVCRTDLHEALGEIPLPRLPLVPGHQVVGRVLAPGRRFPAGARVGISWLRGACGECPDCARRNENLCRRARFTGYHEDGGFAELATVGEAFAFPLPDGLSDAEAAPLLCAGIVGFRAMRQADIAPGESVGFYGFGSSAHIALQVARHWGCRVFVATRGERHRELARRMRAQAVGEARERPPFPLDRAVVFAPAGDLLPVALEAVRPGGTVASAAIHMSPVPPLDYDRHLFGEKTLRSTTAATREDGNDLLAIAASGALRPSVTTYPFDSLPDALADISADRVQGSAVLEVS
jgi:propanol-preferring alcohol dehydrogenase